MVVNLHFHHFLQGGETGKDKGNGRILAAQLKWNE